VAVLHTRNRYAARVSRHQIRHR